MKYPVRCKIIDVTGQLYYGIPMKTPEQSLSYIGEKGLAEKIKDKDSPIGYYVKITLDSGNVIYGHECWWEPLDKEGD